LLVYDVSNHASFEHITNWYQTTQQTGAVKRFYLVGNKSDVSSNERAVTTEEANRFASDRGLFFIETSTKSGSNVTEAFQHIAEGK
ncbi:small GTPase superfamily, partial [Absidia repens]